MNDEIEFFKELLVKTKTEFYKSPIYKKQNDDKNRWGFSICGTPIQKGKGILLGINWGGHGEYDEQKEMPNGNDILTYNFIQRSQPFFDTYLSLKVDKVDFNYTNLCFFRTPDIKSLSFQDYECSCPLFQQYVEYIKPRWIFSLGIKNYYLLKDMKKLSSTEEFHDSESKHMGATGKFLSYNFYAVPHPNARIKTNSRNEIWDKVGKQFINDINS
jgi:hypothetical protein